MHQNLQARLRAFGIDKPRGSRATTVRFIGNWPNIIGNWPDPMHVEGTHAGR